MMMLLSSPQAVRSTAIIGPRFTSFR